VTSGKRRSDYLSLPPHRFYDPYRLIRAEYRCLCSPFLSLLLNIAVRQLLSKLKYNLFLNFWSFELSRTVCVNDILTTYFIINFIIETVHVQIFLFFWTLLILIICCIYKKCSIVNTTSIATFLHINTCIFTYTYKRFSLQFDFLISLAKKREREISVFFLNYYSKNFI